MDHILIIDFGSQTAHLIGRRISRLGIQVHYSSPEEALKSIADLTPKGIVFSGGPASVNDPGAPTLDLKVFELGIPIMGICYGWQLMSKLLGGKVFKERKEYGPENLLIKDNVFRLPSLEFSVIMSHGDSVQELPPFFSIIASTKQVPCAAAFDPARRFFGLQFHPEVHHTEYGNDILRYFAENIAGCQVKGHSIDIPKMLESIRHQVGDAEVLCAVSGGVDSTVAATLIDQAIGKQLHTFYVENDLMRVQTEERVKKLYNTVEIIHARELFLDALKGKTDPEEKRKIIGKLFIELFQKAAQNYPKVKFLAQGTIYSDVIESKGSNLASHIKSHHNVGGLPKILSLQLLEPLKNLYKDEVRELGRLLGIPENFLMEHPFPGPGYAVRIRGEVTEKRLQQVRQADAIIIEELKNAGLYDQLFQCFPVMTGAYSTAVKGDEGIFAEVVAIRAYDSVDIMTAKWARLPYDVLQTLSSRIVNEVPDVSRVVYDISTKPPSTMEWE